MRKKIIRLTESDLHRIIKESVQRILNEGSNNYDLIREVLFNGCFYNLKNDGYDIGVGYGCGNQKEFYYPNSERCEHSYCYVTTDEINQVVRDLENDGYEFERDEDGYVFMKGKREGFKPFVPMKPNPIKKSSEKINPNVDPVGYYSDRLFTQSKDGNLGLF